MLSFAIGFFFGVMFGACVGFVTLGLCVASRNGEGK